MQLIGGNGIVMSVIEKIGGVTLNYQYYKGQDLYSDGPVEDQMLKICQEGSRDEALNNAPSWPVLYHFSPARKNIIEWFPMKEDAAVLEIGAGCGALTGVLSQKAERVVCIELSKKRSLINAYQNQECDNVEIYVGNFEEIRLEEKFDYITLIGVLEYAAFYTKGTNPYKTMLKQVSSMLKPDGKLLVAIENKFGLKYWCGAPEDHTGVPFECLHNYESEYEADRYGSSAVRTFSRQVLQEMFTAVGLTKQRFYYPLPDYKFPSAVFSDNYLPNEDEIRAVKFYYPDNSELVADEKKLYREIIKNNTFPFFANSFFVEVSKSELDEEYVKYASFKRDFTDQYKVMTAIWNSNKVIKKACCKEAVQHIGQIQHNIEALQKMGIDVLMSRMEGNDSLIMPYSRYPLAVEHFNEALQDRDYDELKNMLDMLKNSLKCSSTYHYGQPCSIELPENDLSEILDVAYLDMLFINSFYDNGRIIFFDQEWREINIPLKYIIYRAIKYSGVNMDGVEPIKESLYIEYGINGQVRESFRKYEEIFVLDKMDQAICKFFDSMMYHEGLTVYPQSRKVVSGLYREQKDKTQEIDRQRGEIDRQKEELDRQRGEIADQRLQIDQLIQSENGLKGELNNKKAHIDQLIQSERDLGTELSNKNGHIEQLLQSERDLNAQMKLIKESRVFRIVRIIWKINAVLLPMDSRRRALLRKICHPFRDSVEQEISESNEEMQQLDSTIDYKAISLPEWEMPLVSIVIPVYNEFDYTYQCLCSILDNSGDIPYEVILADDCSTDLTKDIHKVVSHIVVSRTKKNVRFLLNCNQAAKLAKGKYILFLNNDTKVHENWLEPLVALMESDDTIGMTGSKLVYADGTLQEAGGIIWQDGSGWNYGNGQDASLPEFNYVKEVDYISGAAIMIRRDLWEIIGGFDERYVPAYCEDSDLAFEVRKHGYRVVYQPESVVTHFEGVSNGTDLSAGVKQYQVENSRKLCEKWKEELDKQFPNAVNVFQARERSQGKKTILIIDHYVPHFDKDAGSRTIWQYIKLFMEKGYNVKFMGDNFYPHEPYTTALQQSGVEVLYGPWYAENYREWIINNKEYIDFAFLCRPHITEKYIDLLKDETNIKCIYYGSDLHCMRIRREYEVSHEEALLVEAEDWKKREFAIMRKTDVNYYPSSVEIEEIQKVDASISAKTFDIYVYDKFRNKIPMDFSKRKGILFVGGFGHHPNEDAVLWFADQIYPLIREQCDIPFYVVGSSPTEKINKLHGDGIIVKGFVSDEELEELYDTCKMAVIPLRYGAGVKGKVIEALYFGVPMVTTSIGIEGIPAADQIVEIADTPELFAEKTIALYNDNERLVKTVHDYQEYIKTHCSVEAVWEHIREDFTK